MNKRVLSLHTLLPYLILLSTSILMLGANPFANQTVAPMDLLQRYPGWKNTKIETGTINYERSDVLDQKLPAWISAKTCLYKGELPFWSYSIKGGKPGYIFTHSLMSPSFLMFLLIKNNATAFYFSILINLIIGLLGMYLFLKVFLDRYASVFGAITFMFCGFNTAWLFWSHVITSIWAPWVFLFTFNFLKTDQRKYLPFITISMLMLNLGGFPFVAVMTYMALTLLTVSYGFFMGWSYRAAMTKMMLLAFFSSLSVTIAAPFIYPLVELFNWMDGIGYRNGGTIFKLSDLVGFFSQKIQSSVRVETTFYSGIIPFLFLFVAIYFYLKQRDFIAKFGIALFLFATTVAFALINPDIIRLLPTLSINGWGRFSFLIGVSLAIVGGYSFHELTRRITDKKQKILAVSFLLLLNVTDLRILFKRFNGPVPSESFYPQTKTIDHVERHVKPFQYILPDDSYLICGTLSAYGFNDWFAHTFHSKAEKEILGKVVKEPFTSPTSASFKNSQIIFNSPYMDLLNIRYILCQSTEPDLSLWDNHLRPKEPCPDLPFNEIAQPLTTDRAIEVKAINLFIATYGKPEAPGDVEVSVWRSNKILQSSTVMKKNIHDNRWVSFSFQSNLKLEPGKYLVKVRLKNQDNLQTPLTIWSNTEETEHCLLVNEQPVGLSLKMTLTIPGSIPSKYDKASFEPGITTVGNRNVSGSAYFLKELTINSQQNYDNIQVKCLNNREIEILYSGDEKGWIILPMCNYPGWKAIINGESVVQKPFIGMLPAFKVNGKSTITFKYTPKHFHILLIFSFLSICMLVFYIVKYNNFEDRGNDN
jgi:hypothetical protein